MKQYMKGILTLMALAAVIAAIVWLGSPHRHMTSPRVAKLSTEFLVKTTHPVRRNFSARLNWMGRVDSKKVVRILSLAAGKITEVKVSDGTFVRRGDILFTVGGQQVEHMLYALNQRVTSLEKQRSYTSNLVHAKRVALAERLAKREELLSANEHLTHIEGDLSAARNELAAFRAALIIHAPIDGMFVNRKVSPGQDIDKGTHLADIISTNLRVTARLFPPPGVKLLGKTAEIDTPPGALITGSITKVLPQKTPEGATVTWIEGEEIKNVLNVGEQVSGWIKLVVRRDVLAVPQNAVVRDEQERTFVIVEKDHGYVKREVKTGLESGGWCEIVSGLSGTDEVVVQGAYELFYRDFTKTYKVAD